MRSSRRFVRPMSISVCPSAGWSMVSIFCMGMAQPATSTSRRLPYLSYLPSHASSNLVYEFVLFDAVLGPFGVEIKLLLALFPRSSDGDEVGANAVSVGNLVCDAFVGEPKVPRRLDKRRVQDGVFNHYLLHMEYSIRVDYMLSQFRRSIGPRVEPSNERAARFTSTISKKSRCCPLIPAAASLRSRASAASRSCS